MATPSKRPALRNPIVNLTTNLQGLREFLALVEPFLEKEARESGKLRATDLIPLAVALSASGLEGGQPLSDAQEAKLRAKFGAEFKITTTEDGGVGLNVPGEASHRFNSALKEMSLKLSHKRLLFKNGLISLVSSAEWFLSQVLREFFESFPDACGTKDKTLSLDDLQRLGSVEEAQLYLISLRVDDIMWGGLEDWTKFLRNTMKLSMGYLSEDEDKLLEVFQRRNVMVHNNGVVHHSYLAKVPESLRMGVKSGASIDVSPEYLHSAIDTIEKCFVLIGAELWKKLAPKDEERAAVLVDVAIDALHENRYQVAAGASRFLMEDRQLPEKWQLYGRLNYWQTMKWSGKFESVKTDVEGADFTAKDDLMQLARYVLLDQIDNALPLVKTALAGKKLTLKSLDEWPIFREFRNDERVKMLIEVERANTSATVELTPEELKSAGSPEDLAVTAASKQTIN